MSSIASQRARRSHLPARSAELAALAALVVLAAVAHVWFWRRRG